MLLPLISLLFTCLLLLVAWQNRDALSALLPRTLDSGASTPPVPVNFDAGRSEVITPTMTAGVRSSPFSPTARATATLPDSDAVETMVTTVAATATAAINALATATPVDVDTVTPPATPCGPPPGWVIYVARPGDTLFRLSVRYGVSLASLSLANCLTGDRIYSGQRLWVPFALPAPTSPPTAEPSATTSPTFPPPPAPSATAQPPTSTPLPTPTPIATNPPPPPPPP